MRIDVKTEITDYDGKSIPQNSANPDQGNMTLGAMMITALNTPLEKDKNLPADKKVQRAVLSQDIHNALKDGTDGMIDFPHEAIVEVKELMNNFYAPLPLMRAFEIFDPKIEEVTDKEVN